MAKVKIGKKEYEFESLSSLDLKKIEKAKEELKLDDYDYSYYVILYAVKKFNKQVALTVEEFQETFPLVNLEEKFIEIGNIVGLDFKGGMDKAKAGSGKFPDGKTR